MEARGDEPGAFGSNAEQAQATQAPAVEWFASVDGSPVGPLSTEDLVSRIATGVLDWDAHLWREGYAEWKTVGDSDTIVRAVASSRGSLDEAPARGDSTERTTTPQDPDEDDAPTTATLDEAPTIATLEDSPTRVAYDETPTRMFSASAPPSAGLQPVARTQFATRAPSVTGSRPPGELAAVRSRPASYAPGVLPAMSSAAGHGYASAEPHPAPIALPYEAPLHNFSANAQPLPVGRGPASVAPGTGYAGGEGSGLIDIRALASLAQGQRQAPVRPMTSQNVEPRAYERMPVAPSHGSEQAYAYGEAESAGQDPLASFGSNHGVAFAALDSLAPVARAKRPKDATVPLAILTGASMIAAAAFAALYLTRATPATGSAPVSVAQPAAVPPAAPSEPTLAAAPDEEKPAEAVPSDEPAGEVAAAAPEEPAAEAPSAAAEAAPPAQEEPARRAAKRTAPKKQRAARGAAEPAEEEEEEPAAQAKAEEKPPSVDDILLADPPKAADKADKADKAEEPAVAVAPAKKQESASRSIDDLLDNAVGDKKAAAPAAASALPEAPSRNDVLAAMRGIESEVRACAASEATPLEGTANVAITVAGSTGKVTSADVTGIQGQVGSCIARVARKASFSPFSRERFSVSYPYRFKR